MTDERLPWFPCFQSKLLGALGGMEPDVGYVYVIVLLRTYEVGGPCPDQNIVLARRTGMTERRVAKAIEWLLEQHKLTRSEAGLANPYATEVLAERESTTKSLKTAGKLGGIKSALKRSMKSAKPGKPPLENREASVEPGSTHLDLDKEGSETPKGVSSDPPKRRDDWPQDYAEQFWKAYPRREGKKSALAKLDAIRKPGKLPWATLVVGIKRYASHVSGTEQRFIKQPATWLNGGCWDDEYETKPAGADRGYPAAGRPANGADAILAGMGRVASRFAGAEPADGYEDGQSRRVVDVTPGSNTNR